ncbi:TetR/AcrR family transcriptional regulator [Phytomonospora endophytica]|uniref:AcrR family transcriptional regulator n=1 Tax=Phytomonospora endophytica TaxID=714109 RepID=A0A841FMF6_9ACTN|nr:TetR/AcrR family transcriptional regulator [Phytomonospora endophytica]MBB6036093.1 AcrR family transcriptional regulator [Phytomonospora endophytica]GIG66996.1 TetR family transcriptional regulator [Phytomonospora endophytica]
MTGTNVPPDLRRLWRVPAATGLGRPAELDVDRVLGAALDLADRHGLPGVTLPKVAEALGVTKMALYRYVGSKDELLVLLADHAMPPPPEPTDGPWRPALHAWAEGNREVYRLHPWLARVPVAGPPGGPNAIAWLDAALRALRDTALDWAEKVGVVLLLGGWVRQASTLDHGFATGRGDRAQAEVERAYGRALAELVEPGRFPEAARLFASPAFEEPAAEDPDFRFGLDVLLDGVAARIAAAEARG